ncbi:MAG: hypothetical protein GWP09_02200, partial [Nitrospiraceae bacterium]|nr:hypothetical protein [Nitrospiraceae bacterium]
SKEKIRENREKGIECDCRNNSVEKNLSEWEDMLSGKYEAGERVLRLKIDMKSKNYVMRDPIIFRIIKKSHYRQGDKYCVWPMYDFEAALEDHFCGITHVLRSNEFGTMRVELQNYIRKQLGYSNPVVVQYGRFNVVGFVTEGRKIREMIENHEINGWDDPRLITLRALRRRGFVKDTFYQLVKEVGLSKTPTNIDQSMLETINRKIIDPIAKRFFFVENPVKLEINGAIHKVVKLKIFPDKEEPVRSIEVKENCFYVAKDDYNSLISDDSVGLFRLMDLFNFRRNNGAFEFVSEDYSDFKGKGNKIIQWLPCNPSSVLKVSVVMPDATVVVGLGESNIKKLNVGDIVQFVRFGFCRLDHFKRTENYNKGSNKNYPADDDIIEVVFYYAHK